MDSLDYPSKYVRAHQTPLTDLGLSKKGKRFGTHPPAIEGLGHILHLAVRSGLRQLGLWDRVIQVGDLGFVKESMEGGELLVVSRTRFECSIYTLLASLGPELTGYVHVAQVLPQLFYGVDDSLSLGARLVVGQAYDIVQ